jgi:hypothetical protein
MMQALYEAILEDEAVLEEAFKYEVLARQAEASGDQELTEVFCQMRYEKRRRAERAERLLAQRLPEKKRFYTKRRVRRNDKMQQKGSNRSLEEEARRLKQGAHRYRRQEAKVCRDPEREATILVEKCKEEQASD